MNASQRFIKRVIDIAVAGTALILTSPLTLTLCVLVRLSSPGPVFFRQVRIGKNGKTYRIWKFRTMVDRAPDLRNKDGSAYNADDDPRVTAIGRTLRKTSLDELPQLLNVLVGEMSLVGPRPDQADQLQYYSEAEKKKLYVKPGITGLAQISGRNSISWEQRKKFDIEYVEKQSLRLDIAILFRTIPYVLLRKDVFVSSDSL
jgi:undecaprenyl phosphate N,N'-diacetylbacillosamine 1-phosphate transferase